jgi:hypothetical protein
MRSVALFALSAGLAVAVVLGIASAQDTKTTAEPMPGRGGIDPDLVWNFHFEGKKKGGEFLELLTPEEGKERALVITHFEMRVRQSTQVQMVEHRKVKRQGKEVWEKAVRRSELFSLGTLDSTTQYVASGFDSTVGMKFDGGTRPALEVTAGGGEMAVYAAGYWERK